MGVRDENFLNYFVFIKKDQDLDKKFRLVTAMHRNGPLPQVSSKKAAASILQRHSISAKKVATPILKRHSMSAKRAAAHNVKRYSISAKRRGRTYHKGIPNLSQK